MFVLFVAFPLACWLNRQPVEKSAIIDVELKRPKFTHWKKRGSENTQANMSKGFVNGTDEQYG